jgi:hypothetical protein
MCASCVPLRACPPPTAPHRPPRCRDRFVLRGPEPGRASAARRHGHWKTLSAQFPHPLQLCRGIVLALPLEALLVSLKVRHTHGDLRAL